MADLKCSVENCVYNKDCLCSKGDIMVGNKHADRKSVKHFFDILFGKRYDAEDMVILREQDFIIK